MTCPSTQGNLRFAAFGFLLSFLLVNPVHATSLESETTAATNSSSESISGDGHLKGETKKGESEPEDSPWNWNLGGSYSLTKVPASATAPQIIDKTTGVTLGVGWDQDLMIGAGLAYSATPDERLSNVGPSLYVGYTFKFPGRVSSGNGVGSLAKKAIIKKTQPEKSAVDQEDEELNANEEFVPSISLKVPLATLKYTIQPTPVTASPTTRRKPLAPPPPPAGAEITHKSAGLELSYNALAWLSFRVSFVKYTYDHDVNKFVANLDSPRAVRAGVSGLGSTVSGLPLNVFAFGVGLTPLEHWSLDFDDSITTQATDRSKSRALKLMLERDLGEAWKIGLGIENEHSLSLNENLVLVKVVFDF